jgi:hypothetical protein
MQLLILVMLMPKNYQSNQNQFVYTPRTAVVGFIRCIVLVQLMLISPYNNTLVCVLLMGHRRANLFLYVVLYVVIFYVLAWLCIFLMRLI